MAIANPFQQGAIGSLVEAVDVALGSEMD